MTPRACMILAAGFGTRLQPLTRTRPKPLINVAGHPLIDHALEQARGAGAAPIAVNGHYRADQLAAHLAAAPDVRFIEETPAILDSGGGIRNALPILGKGPIWTLNADAVWRGSNPLRLLSGAWYPERMGGLLLLVPMARAAGRKGGGDFALDRAGRITQDADGAVWTGAQILGADVFNDTPDGPFAIWLIWRRLMAARRLFGIIYRGHWADAGHPAGLAQAEDMLRST
ncbi:MAG: nucleotidyltransferase family protein [Rhodobacteraceae bacterium]|nr:nucleotidyltransferase family protein [Paracoccaceae bacterium]